MDNPSSTPRRSERNPNYDLAVRAALSRGSGLNRSERVLPSRLTLTMWMLALHFTVIVPAAATPLQTFSKGTSGASRGIHVFE